MIGGGLNSYKLNCINKRRDEYYDDLKHLEERKEILLVNKDNLLKVEQEKSQKYDEAGFIAKGITDDLLSSENMKEFRKNFKKPDDPDKIDDNRMK